MLPIRLQNPTPERDTKYGNAITHLASNTSTFRGADAEIPSDPDFDISQVNCWMSEQPLANGMRLCTTADNNGEIKLIDEKSAGEGEPVDEDNEGDDMEVDENGAAIILDEALFANLVDSDPNNLLLISPDCWIALKESLEYLRESGADQTLITNTRDSSNPLSWKNYIFPNTVYTYDPEATPHVEACYTNAEEIPTTYYTSQDCFIYTKKTALVHHMVEDEEGENRLSPVSSDFKQCIFIEPNPALPEPLRIMAQNTIHLFQLNSRFADYQLEPTTNVHNLVYNHSKNEIEYDDLRLVGRMNAYRQARKNFKQIKHMRHLSLDPETMEMFTSQHKILLELTGYSSTWKAVFHDGGDPESFNRISTPTPTAPLAGGESIEEDTSNALDINSDVAMGEAIIEASSDDEDDDCVLNSQEIEDVQSTFVNNEDLWEGGGFGSMDILNQEALREFSLIIANIIYYPHSNANSKKRKFQERFVGSNTVYRMHKRIK